MSKSKILFGAVAGMLAMSAAGASFAQYTFNTGLTSSDAEARSIVSTRSGTFGAENEAKKAAAQGEQAPVGRYADAVAQAVAPPGLRAQVYVGDWNGAESDWVAHAQQCRARYRSYNPNTDMYQAGPGHMERCMLGQ